MKKTIAITCLALSLFASADAVVMRPDCVTVVQKTANAGWGGEDSDFEQVSIVSYRDSGKTYMAGRGPIHIMEVLFSAGVHKGVALVDPTSGGCFVEKMTLSRF